MSILIDVAAVIAFWATLVYIIWSLSRRPKTTTWIPRAGLAGVVGGLSAAYLSRDTWGDSVVLAMSLGMGAIILHLLWQVSGDESPSESVTSKTGNNVAMIAGSVLVILLLVLGIALAGWARWLFVLVALLLGVRLGVARSQSSAQRRS